MKKSVTPTGCCEPFDPKPWENKTIVWKNKLFVNDQVACFFHIPLNMEKKIVYNMQLIENARAKSPYQLMLTDGQSPWKSDIYIDVSRNVPDAKVSTLSGTFLTKVFEGPYQNAGIWANDMKEYVAKKGKTVRKLYFSYTTCPRCAKAYGKNYVVLFAQID